MGVGGLPPTEVEPPWEEGREWMTFTPRDGGGFGNGWGGPEDIG